MVATIAFLTIAIILGVVAPIPAYAADVLTVVWQAQAGILGLSVAVAVFAFQSFGELRSARRRLVTLTGFPAALMSGLALNFYIGAATITRIAPWGGWLGVSAVAFTGGWLCLLILVFEKAPHVQDTGYSLGIRIRALKSGAAAAVDGIVLERVSRHVMQERVEALGGSLEIWPSGEGAESIVVAPAEGTIVDVDLHEVDLAIRLAVANGQSMTIGFWLGQRLRRQGTIASSDRPITEAVRGHLRRAVIVCPARHDSVNDDLNDLHSEAMEAIGRTGSAGVVGEVLDTYTEVLGDYAQAWLAYTNQLSANNLPGYLENAEGPLDAIRSSVRELFRNSVERGDRDAAFQIVYFPVGLAVRAVEWRSPGYFPIVGLYPQFYGLAARGAVDTDTRVIFTERAWWHPVEALELMVPALVRVLPSASLPLADQLRQELHKTLFEVFRICIRNGDLANLREGLRRWRLAGR